MAIKIREVIKLTPNIVFSELGSVWIYQNGAIKTKVNFKYLFPNHMYTNYVMTLKLLLVKNCVLCKITQT